MSPSDDYLGIFAITTGHGVEELVDKYKQQNDDYNAIMVKVIADRLAEALAEKLHEKVRKEYWGYTQDENLNLNASGCFSMRLVFFTSPVKIF